MLNTVGTCEEGTKLTEAAPAVPAEPAICHWTCNGSVDTPADGNACEQDEAGAQYCFECIGNTALIDAGLAAGNSPDGYGTCTPCGIDYCNGCEYDYTN